MHKLVFFLITRPLLYVAVTFLVRAVALGIVERKWPAHAVPYRKVWAGDTIAVVFCALAVIPAAEFINRWVAIRPALPNGLLELPLVLRFALYMVVADFGSYWVHRVLHTRYLWSAHKWHHSPSHMYWLAGARGSLVQQVIVNVPYIFAQGFLEIHPWWLASAVLTKNMLQNDWMHLNVKWGSDWIEWFIVTPRYHHIHHSDNPAHYRGNLASLFPVWDHLFGTYVNPNEVPRELSFGIGERVRAIRLAVGV